MERAGTELELSDKELRRLKRAELLEMLLEQSRENEALMTELEEKNRIIEALNLKLENRKIDLKNAGTIAEASFKLNGVFEAAEKAAEQYLENLQDLCEREQNLVSEKEAEVERQCAMLLRAAKEHCDSMTEETIKHCEAMTLETELKCKGREKRSRRKTYFAETERKSRCRSRMKETLWLKKKRKSEN